jgi:hypothetical protein
VNVGLGSIMIALQGSRDLPAINVMTAQKLPDALPTQAMSRRAMWASMRGEVHGRARSSRSVTLAA